MQYCIDLAYYYADVISVMCLLAVLVLAFCAITASRPAWILHLRRNAQKSLCSLFYATLPFIKAYSFIPYTALILWLLGVSRDDLMIWCFGLFFLFSFVLVNAFVIKDSDDIIA